MWRSMFIICLLAGLPAASPALAAQASAVIQVGITITGGAAQTPAKATQRPGRPAAASRRRPARAVEPAQPR